MKFVVFLKYTLMVAMVGLVIFPETASAKSDCKRLDGKWSGNMRGVISGKTSMSIKNCRVSWRLPDGRFNQCQFKNKSGKIEYSCSLGSRGSVVVKGKNITMRNIYTARKHGAYKVNISKVSQ